MLKVQIERMLRIVKAMEHWPYSDTDYSSIRQKLEIELQEKAEKARREQLKPQGYKDYDGLLETVLTQARKAPGYMSYEKFNLKRVTECRITKNDLTDLMGKDVSITFYGPDMVPLYRRGVVTELEARYIRLETPLAGMAYFIQYFRVIRVQVFEKRKVVREIWYDKGLH